MTESETQWIKVAVADEMPEGRVKTVTAGTRTLALTHDGPALVERVTDAELV